MKLYQIARGRVLEGKPAHPGNPNPAMASNADTQAKAKAKTSAERDRQLDQERAAEKGPNARDTEAERDRKNRKVTLQKLSSVTDWSPTNQTSWAPAHSIVGARHGETAGRQVSNPGSTIFVSTRTPRPGELYEPKPARAAVPGDLAKGIAPKPPVPPRPPTKHTGPTGPKPPKGMMAKQASKSISKRAVKPATRDGKR